MPTTFVVAAAWRGTGIGNSIYHAALWLTLTRQLDAHVKFAQCLPAGTYHLNTSSETRRLRRGELPPELRAIAMYTMLPEWSNAGDRAVATWHTDNPSASFAADAKDTVAAWLTLASCTEAIIAPVASSFSSLAQLRAGTRVRYTHCCGAH